MRTRLQSFLWLYRASGVARVETGASQCAGPIPGDRPSRADSNRELNSEPTERASKTASAHASSGLESGIAEKYRSGPPPVASRLQSTALRERADNIGQGVHEPAARLRRNFRRDLRLERRLSRRGRYRRLLWDHSRRSFGRSPCFAVARTELPGTRPLSLKVQYELAPAKTPRAARSSWPRNSGWGRSTRGLGAGERQTQFDLTRRRSAKRQSGVRRSTPPVRSPRRTCPRRGIALRGRR